MQSAVQRFACTQCGKCCDRSPEVELSEASALADVFVFRLLFRAYELPRTFADYLASGGAAWAEHFHQRKRLLGSFAARKSAARKRIAGKSVEYVQYLSISALTVDGGSGVCSALSDGRCGIYERRPLSCRTAPFHYSRTEASAERDLAAFVATPGYRCDTGADAPMVLEAGRIVDEQYHRTRAAALALAERDRPWQQAIVRRMKDGRSGSALPRLREIEPNATVAATASMAIAWQIAAESGLMTAAECSRLIMAQAATIDRDLTAATCSATPRETLTDMRAEYRQLIDSG